eukprot:XP_001708165.1 Hypothetical protein GL50803_89815 [Giardia lamblia ATCC 50803]
MPLGTTRCSETPDLSSSSWTAGIGASRCDYRLCKNRQPYRCNALHHGADCHHPRLPSRPRQGRCQQRWQAQLLRTSGSEGCPAQWECHFGNQAYMAPKTHLRGETGPASDVGSSVLLPTSSPLSNA